MNISMTEQNTFPDLDAKPDLGVDGSNTNKRKRDSLDHDAAPRPAPGAASGFHRVSPSANNTTTGHADLNDQTTAEFLTAHNNSEGDIQHSNPYSQLHQNGGTNATNSSDTAAAALHYSMTVPQATELSFQTQSSGGEGDRPLGASFNIEGHGAHGLGDFGLDALKGGAQGNAGGADHSPTGTPGHKPPVGSEEWHKIRRDNHKEGSSTNATIYLILQLTYLVERRRRETINEGINELAKIVPGCEKNKGSILQRAVQFIQQLKENESQNIEKWTLEKLLTEQAITELSSSVDKLKSDLQRSYDELEVWKRACQSNGIVPEEFKDQDGSTQNGDS
jgi:transcriptional regulator CBF1